MKKYLLKLHKINKNISDISDYEAFLDSAQEYIKTHEKEQEEILNSLINKLTVLKSSLRISLIYKILSVFNKNILFFTRISKKLLIKHFSIKSIRDSILEYVTSQDIHIIDKIINKKLINHKKFVSENLYKYIHNNPECVYDFLKKKNPDIFLKQICIIRNSNIKFDMKYYMKFLGSNSKFIAFNVFETFLRVFKNKYKYKLLNGYIFFPEDSLIEIDEKLDIESPLNFIKYGFNFIKNRNLIINKINSRNYDELADCMNFAFKKKIIPSDFEKNYDNGLCYAIETIPNKNLKIFETNFDYIFSKLIYKDICDCLEL